MFTFLQGAPVPCTHPTRPAVAARDQDARISVLEGTSHGTIQYCYRVTPRSEIIVGYRRYTWRKPHVDYQLVPQWDHFYEKNEDKRYPLGFDLWNEFRLGYT